MRQRALAVGWAGLASLALCAAEPPDVRGWRPASYDDAFYRGRAACSEEALTFWM
jgi:hypothetical protein